MIWDLKELNMLYRPEAEEEEPLPPPAFAWNGLLFWACCLLWLAIGFAMGYQVRGGQP